VAELLTERWTLVVAGGFLATVAALGWKRGNVPIWLAYSGVAFAWGIGVMHNLGLRLDLGYG
jgi:hypothetical protein